MLNEQELITQKARVVTLLASTEREGISKVIDYLNTSDFFVAPASTRFHGCYKGGLAKHSLNVFDLLIAKNEELSLGVDENTIIIAALLHDVCKIGAYVPTKAGNGFTNNRNKDKGHAILSLKRIAEFIALTELEIKMIQFHMGVYGLDEFEPGKGEYTLRNKGMAYAWYHNPIVKVMYFCDELATLQEKTEE